MDVMSEMDSVADLAYLLQFPDSLPVLDQNILDELENFTNPPSNSIFEDSTHPNYEVGTPVTSADIPATNEGRNIQHCPADGGKSTKGGRRPRTVFSARQLELLENEFASSEYISSTRRRELARSLTLEERQIKVWFQNRRLKSKKENRKSSSAQGEKPSASKKAFENGSPSSMSYSPPDHDLQSHHGTIGSSNSGTSSTCDSEISNNYYSNNQPVYYWYAQSTVKDTLLPDTLHTSTTVAQSQPNDVVQLRITTVPENYYILTSNEVLTAPTFIVYK